MRKSILVANAARPEVGKHTRPPEEFRQPCPRDKKRLHRAAACPLQLLTSSIYLRLFFAEAVQLLAGLQLCRPSRAVRFNRNRVTHLSSPGICRLGTQAAQPLGRPNSLNAPLCV